ncbi:helix-turn-helix domain-containing protein, partial [Liquorilactobacillus vini]|uniref:helix-turn-helix domain-containing protein n=1 Tax=Liquorilactobacillus vini TaxID=238015 RepID=UPI00055574E8
MSHYQHLTINDREMILEGLAQSKTIREIARNLKRAPSTISREIKRHKHGDIGRYSPDKAQSDYKFSKSKCGRKPRLLEDTSLFQKIKHLFLDCQWSPEEISQRLLLETGET